MAASSKQCGAGVWLSFLIGFLVGVCITLSVVMILLLHFDQFGNSAHGSPHLHGARGSHQEFLPGHFPPGMGANGSAGGSVARLVLPSGAVLMAPPELVLPWLMAPPMPVTTPRPLPATGPPAVVQRAEPGLLQGRCTGTFISNEGGRWNQSPFRVDDNTYVFGGFDGGAFKMRSVDATGKPKEDRYTVGITNIKALTVAIWAAANAAMAGVSYSVVGVSMGCAARRSPTLMPELPPLMEKLETISIIFACRNEHEYLQKTIESVMATTPGGELPGTGLKEIIVFDDASDTPMEAALSNWRAQWPRKSDIMKFLRVPESVGLMNARLQGAKGATGDVFVFLDCHVNTTMGWWPPLKRHVNENYRRIATPSIPALNEDWSVSQGQQTVGQTFDWSLDKMEWIDSPNDWVMVMCGGLYAISRRWWFESGEYDPGMKGWGTEQLEQSVRTWLCGGEVVIDRTSVIGHMYRAGKPIPYKNSAKSFITNKLRAVEVWFDEYKEYFYYAHAKDENYKLPADFDIKERLELKRRLQCKPFSWFVQRFRPYFLLSTMIADDRPVKNCRWTAPKQNKFLGTVAWVWPNITAQFYNVDVLGKEKARERARDKCEELGSICAGVTCDDDSCTARRGQPFMRDSKAIESSQVKVCCQYKKVEGHYLPRTSYMSPAIPASDVGFHPDQLDFAFNRCEVLTDLCVGVTCDAKICIPREGAGGLRPSPTGEVTWVKDCSNR